MDEITPAQRRIVPVPEACELLGGVSRTILWHLARSGEIKQLNIGRRVFFVADSIDDYITRRIEQASA